SNASFRRTLGDDTAWILQLRPAAYLVPGGAGENLDLPLPRLPETNGERLRISGPLSSRAGHDRREDEGIRAAGGQRTKYHLPLLPAVRLDRLLDTAVAA